MPLQVQQIADIGELERLAPEWDEIDAFSSPRTPFTSPMWNLLWWRHFRENRFWVRDELFVLAVRDESGRLVALAPLMRTLRPGWGPMRVREIQFFGAGTDLLEFRGMVCRPSYRDEAARVIHAYLLQRAGEWESLLWCGVPAGEQVETLGQPRPYRTVKDYYLRLPESWAELKRGLSRNMKEALRKCYNSLRRDGHAFTFRAISAPEEIDAALDDFFRLHRARAELKGKVPHPDRFRPARSRRFFRDFAHHMAQRGQLRIFQLDIGGKVVATRIGFALGKEIYFYYSGYAPEWGRFSVMTTLTVEAIKWALERGFHIVNLSTGSDYAKARWEPSELQANDYLVWSPEVRGSFLHGRIFGLLRHAPPQSLLGRVVGIARRDQ
jgi:CelD/BcsL family acetyltransferase involved in cellulose biosynthesis